MRKPNGIGLFYRNYRSLLEETSWLRLGAGFINVGLETRLAGSKPVVSVSRARNVTVFVGAREHVLEGLEMTVLGHDFRGY